MIWNNKCILHRIHLQSCENALYTLTYHHSLQTFPESVSQSFLHGISDICHLVLVNIHIVSLDESLRKTIKICSAR